jgi:hypothetical protein
LSSGIPTQLKHRGASITSNGKRLRGSECARTDRKRLKEDTATCFKHDVRSDFVVISKAWNLAQCETAKQNWNRVFARHAR